MSKKRITVLVVDDSAFARKVIREVLSRDSEIEVVGIARDGLEALEKIAELHPDVVTLDLVMPDLDGLGVLKALKGLSQVPKVVIVSVSGSDAELAMEALQMGAVDLVTKPTPLPTDRLYELSDELVKKVKAVAAARAINDIAAADYEALGPAASRAHTLAKANLIVIGTSTGGPQALTQFFKNLPEGFSIPIAVALHIPAGYTTHLAARISQNSPVPLVEAYNGLELKSGQAVIAPGGMHMKIVQREDHYIAQISSEPSDSLYHPSIDILFKSAAEAAAGNLIGIVLTGMGNDGTEGARLIKAAGGVVLAESEASCVVFGMPRSVIEADLCAAEAPLAQIPQLLLDFIYGDKRQSEFQ